MYHDPGFLKQTETATEPWRQLMLDAADLLDGHGWCVGMLRNKNGEYCTWGALFTTWRNRLDELPEMLERAFQELTRYLEMPITVWNDTLCRNKAEAVATLRAVALADSKPGPYLDIGMPITVWNAALNEQEADGGLRAVLMFCVE